jgi:hypothetical protein
MSHHIIILSIFANSLILLSGISSSFISLICSIFMLYRFILFLLPKYE